MSVAIEIQRLQQAKSDLAVAIEGKGVTVPASTKFDGYADLVDAIEQGGGGGLEVKDVNFYDYDGELLHSYTAEEFLALNALPANPEHAGLVAQGWNWTLEEARSYVQKYGMLVVGQQYTTSDGKTRIYITLPYGISLNLRFSQTSQKNVVIDWGDGSEPDISSATAMNTSLSHTYAEGGDYVITVECRAGTMGLGFTNQTLLNVQPVITRAEIGDNVTTIGQQAGAFQGATNLETISIPQGVSVTGFYICRKLQGLVYPKGTTNLGMQNLCAGATAVRCIALPPTIAGVIGQAAFSNIYNCAMITLPEGVTGLNANAISTGNFRRVSIPDTATALGASSLSVNALLRGKQKLNITVAQNYLCSNDVLLDEVQIADDATTINNNAFYNCAQLRSINLPETLTAIRDNAFSSCAKLNIPELYLPALTTLGASAFSNTQVRKIESLGSITSILSYAFSNCWYLTEATLPATLTTIIMNAFNASIGLDKVVCLATTPPTLGANAFYGCPLTDGIYVPAESVEAYKAATNWSAFADKIKPIE